MTATSLATVQDNRQRRRLHLIVLDTDVLVVQPWQRLPHVATTTKHANTTTTAATYLPLLLLLLLTIANAAAATTIIAFAASTAIATAPCRCYC